MRKRLWWWCCVLFLLPGIASAVTMNEFGHQEGEFLYFDIGMHYDEVYGHEEHEGDKETIEDLENVIVLTYEAHGKKLDTSVIVRYLFKKPEQILVGGQAYYYSASIPDYAMSLFQLMVEATIEEYGDPMWIADDVEEFQWAIRSQILLRVKYVTTNTPPYVLYEVTSVKDEHQIEE